MVCVEGGPVAEYSDGAQALAEAVRIKREGWEEYGVPDLVSVVVHED